MACLQFSLETVSNKILRNGVKQNIYLPHHLRGGNGKFSNKEFQETGNKA
jgi:hypothetical protein